MSATKIKMLNYSVVSTLICCGILFIYISFYKKGKKIHIEDIALSILLIVISSLRYGMGSDYFRYLESASRWARLFSSNVQSLFTADVLQTYSYEIGYKLLSVISYKISDSPYTIFWLVSIITYFPLVLYSRKHTEDSRVAIAIYLLFGYWGLSLNAIDQSIAMIFILLAKNAIDNKKYVVGTLLILCAEMFHTTAIVAATLIILSNVVVIKSFFEPTKRNLLLMIVIGLTLKAALDFLLNIASNFSLFAQYSNYTDTGVSEKITRKYMMIGAFIETLLVVVILYLSIKKLEKDIKNKYQLSQMISVVMIGIPFSIIGISGSDWLWLSNRFAEYFFLFLIVLIPEMIHNSNTGIQRGIIKIEKKRASFWVAMVVWHAIFAVVMFNNNQFVIDTYLFK